MDISRFFIDRPRFAGVISIFVFLVGVLAIFQLPVAEYPEVTPPQVVVRAQFPGANPREISETVAMILEEQINGVENLLYFESQAIADGSLAVTVTFKIGTNPEVAETAVQNRINRALPRLPEIVRQIGITTEKVSPNLTMVVHLACSVSLAYLREREKPFGPKLGVERRNLVRRHSARHFYAVIDCHAKARCSASG